MADRPWQVEYRQQIAVQSSSIWECGLEIFKNTAHVRFWRKSDQKGCKVGQSTRQKIKDL